MSPKSATSSSSNRTRKTRNPAYSSLNFVAAEALDQQILGQPYPRAKPGKFTMYRQFSGSKHSVDGIRDDTDVTHYLKPKSRLKIAWSNENRTMNRTKRNDTAQDLPEIASIYRSDSVKDSWPSSAIANNTLVTFSRPPFGTERKAVTRALTPASPIPQSLPRSQNIGEHIWPELSDVIYIAPILPEPRSHDKNLDTTNSPVITPPLGPVRLSETHIVSQFVCVPNAALQFHHQTSSPQSPIDNDANINDYMHSNSSGSLYGSSSPIRYSSPMTTPNTSPSPIIATKLYSMTNISSNQYQNHFDFQLSLHNVSPTPEDVFSTPAPLRTIGAIDDTVLIALTEPFLLVWCQDITQESLAHTQDGWEFR